MKSMKDTLELTVSAENELRSKLKSVLLDLMPVLASELEGTQMLLADGNTLRKKFKNTLERVTVPHSWQGGSAKNTRIWFNGQYGYLELRIDINTPRADGRSVFYTERRVYLGKEKDGAFVMSQNIMNEALDPVDIDHVRELQKERNELRERLSTVESELRFLK